VTLPCTPTERPPGRHDLVFVGPQGWRAMLGTREDLAVDPLVARWSREGWPTIRRRAVPGEPIGLPLGMPLPPFAGKKRLSFVLESDDIVSIARPPLLGAVSEAAPLAWQPTLDRLAELVVRHSVQARVFGSLAWGMLTGLDYVTGRSDLDLLLDVGGEADLDGLTAGVAAIEAAAPMRIDGELMRDDGAAVNWREYRAGAGQVLVKRIDGVSLIDRQQFISERAMS
jgi:phosphoribosyl-dephospho-CoA transferase